MRLKPPWHVIETIVTPLYFARRRQWLRLFFNTCFFLTGVAFVVVLLGGDERGGALMAGFFAWLLCYTGILASKRSQAIAAAGPRAPDIPRSRRLAEAGLIVAVGVVTAVGGVGLPAQHDPAPVHASRYQAAALEAAWIVEQSRQYREAHGRNPADLNALTAAAPTADLDARDPWGRPWVLSPAFGAIGPPAGEVWVCSRGARGRGDCRSRGAATGSAGFDERSGAWTSSWEPGVTELVARVFLMVLFLAPVPAFVVYRILRRIRRNPAPAMTGGFAVGIFLFMVTLIGAAMMPLQARMVERAREAKTRADIHALAAAIDEYRSCTGTTPVKLADLTRPVATASGGTAEPVLQHLPSPVPGGEYRYRRWPDGRYFLLWNDPGSQRPAVIHEGGQARHRSGA